MKEIKLKSKPFITAEIGINHNGDMDIVKKLIDIARNNGCDAVKFQKRTIEIVYSKEVLDTPRESPWGTTTREQKYRLELNEKQYDEIDAYCKKVGIDWYASAWDIPSLHFLRKYNCKYNKIASAMLTHKEFLEEVAKEKKITFVSTGMSILKQVDEAVDIFKKYDCPIILMHTNSKCPCPDEECNVRTIIILRERYKVPVGYSGHDVGILPSVLATTLGAVAIEKHITLDRTSYGSDQAASLEPRGVYLLVRDCRAVESVLGDGAKRIYPGEEVVAKKLRYWEKHE